METQQRARWIARIDSLRRHQATTVAAVLDVHGKLVMESIIETKASALLDFVRGVRGELHVTLEEGSWAAWLHDVLQPQVQRSNRQ